MQGVALYQHCRHGEKALSYNIERDTGEDEQDVPYGKAYIKHHAHGNEEYA